MGHCGILKKDKNGAVIPVGGASTVSNLSYYYNLHVNKGDKIKPVYDTYWTSNWRDWCNAGSIPQKANTETSGHFSTMWDEPTSPMIYGVTFYPYKESSGNTVENNSANGIYYRKHSDGFLEMWDKISGGTGVNGKDINFPINFIDDNYSVTTSISNAHRDAGSFVYVSETTVSGMNIFGSNGSTIRWKAEGYWK